MEENVIKTVGFIVMAPLTSLPLGLFLMWFLMWAFAAPERSSVRARSGASRRCVGGGASRVVWPGPYTIPVSALAAALAYYCIRIGL